MHDAGIAGLPGPAKVKRIKGTPTSDDLVERKFARSALDELWVTDITEHRTREGKVYCCGVMDTCSRRIVGWSIDSIQDTQLVVNALDMAIKQRRAKRGSIVHADHGVHAKISGFAHGRERRAGARRILLPRPDRRARCRRLRQGDEGSSTPAKAALS
jgi:transposase InsO family protein